MRGNEHTSGSESGQRPEVPVKVSDFHRRAFQLLRPSPACKAGMTRRPRCPVAPKAGCVDFPAYAHPSQLFEEFTGRISERNEDVKSAKGFSIFGALRE